MYKSEIKACLLKDALAEGLLCLQAIESARLDAELLLAHVLCKKRTFLRAWPDYVLSENERVTYQRLLYRRQGGEPLAYITGCWEFWSLPLKVTPHTLIPRPETELLVELALQCLPPSSQWVADLGTGSGAIALALAKERPHWQIWATDQSSEALAVAQENAGQLNLSTIRFALGDWCAALPPEQRFDMILSNPPYIAPDDEHLTGDGVCFEPATALISTNQGLSDLEKIVQQAYGRLCPGGWLLLEHGSTQASAVREILAAQGFGEITTCLDLSGLERVTQARR